MKKLLVACSLLSGFASTPMLADATQDLQNRLDKVNSFYANFSQTISSSNGDVVEQGVGELWIKRPNLFNWHMTSPDESVLISDGQTLWFYNPLVEQVTATWLKNATEKTPFMLITRNNANDWKEYQVKQKGDDFELAPKSSSSNLKQFTITVTHSGTIRSFAVVEQDGQRSTYVLKSQQDVSADSSKFTFIPIQGVTLDDQRQ